MQGSLFPWDRIPQAYQWAAVDADGDACAYQNCPTLVIDDEGWNDYHAECLYLGTYDSRLYGTWQDTLEKRPI